MKLQLAFWMILMTTLPGLAAANETPSHAPDDPSVLVGPVGRENVEAAVPAWVQTEGESHPDAAAAKALTAVEPGGEVTVFLGTWCGDSRREVSRLWRALDEIGGTVPFKIEYNAVDREKKDPAGMAEASGIRFVPTFIVKRGGKEVGRIVESSPNGIEADLGALLTGKAQGVLSASQETAAEPANPTSPPH
jgi:hypothetical protein